MRVNDGPEDRAFVDLLDALPGGPGRSVLDLACGEGSRLALAVDRGWKAFGVEPSAPARDAARRSFGHRMFKVDRLERLVPHEFDLILLHDLVDRVSDPCAPFFSLFRIGAIGPKTIVLIRAGARFAAGDLEALLRRLRFTSIEATTDGRGEASLVHRASGSDFAEFMHERFIPGTW